MDKYAVVKIGPFQYTLQEGKEYSLPKFEAEEGKKLEIADVLVYSDGKSVEFGNPVVKGITVSLNILEQGKGEKIKTRVYKAKSRYRKLHGFRIRETRVKVESIGKTAAKAEAKIKPEAKAKATKKVSK